jgi:hypothetical protein
MPFQKGWAKNERIRRGRLETRIVRFHNFFGHSELGRVDERKR